MANTAEKHGSALDRIERDYTRDYWRSAIMNAVVRELGHTTLTFEPILCANKGTIGASMLNLLDELCAQEVRDGRTLGMHKGCIRQCKAIARGFPQLRTQFAPHRSCTAIQQSEELFA